MAARHGLSQWAYAGEYEARGHPRSWSVRQIDSRQVLGEITGLPVIELDKVFWRPGLVATPRDQWVVVQEKLVAKNGWIMDGDLGHYDAVEVRLRAADTIIFLDFSLVRCAWRAARRSREGADFWRWLLTYRCQSRPVLRQAIAKHAASAELRVLRDPEALRRFVADVGHESRS